jgi:adenosylcobinamide-phosphate synthase
VRNSSQRLAADGLTALLGGAALKPSFAIRALFEAVEEVERDLVDERLVQARASASQIVSRDTSRLDAPLLAAAAIESLAENASDSVVAPLLYARLVGLPGAYAYRAINTLDAMIGYRGKYEYLGKAAARLDDLANLVPARLTALLIALAAPVVGTHPLAVLGRLRTEAGRTASPNAGWPMAAAALALRVRLEKREHYVLNPAGRPPEARDVRRARRLVATALMVGAVGFGLVDICLGFRAITKGQTRRSAPTRACATRRPLEVRWEPDSNA